MSILKYLSEELKQLLAEAKRKCPLIKEPAEKALVLLQNLQKQNKQHAHLKGLLQQILRQNHNIEPIIKPFLMSCSQNKSPKMVLISLNCLQQLTTHEILNIGGVSILIETLKRIVGQNAFFASTLHSYESDDDLIINIHSSSSSAKKTIDFIIPFLSYKNAASAKSNFQKQNAPQQPQNMSSDDSGESSGILSYFFSTPKDDLPPNMNPNAGNMSTSNEDSGSELGGTSQMEQESIQLKILQICLSIASTNDNLPSPSAAIAPSAAQTQQHKEEQEKYSYINLGKILSICFTLQQSTFSTVHHTAKATIVQIFSILMDTQRKVKPAMKQKVERIPEDEEEDGDGKQTQEKEPENDAQFAARKYKTFLNILNEVFHIFHNRSGNCLIKNCSDKLNPLFESVASSKTPFLQQPADEIAKFQNSDFFSETFEQLKKQQLAKVASKQLPPQPAPQPSPPPQPQPEDEGEKFTLNLKEQNNATFLSKTTCLQIFEQVLSYFSEKIPTLPDVAKEYFCEKFASMLKDAYAMFLFNSNENNPTEFANSPNQVKPPKQHYLQYSFSLKQLKLIFRITYHYLICFLPKQIDEKLNPNCDFLVKSMLSLLQYNTRQGNTTPATGSVIPPISAAANNLTPIITPHQTKNSSANVAGGANAQSLFLKFGAPFYFILTLFSSQVLNDIIDPEINLVQFDKNLKNFKSYIILKRIFFNESPNPNNLTSGFHTSSFANSLFSTINSLIHFIVSRFLKNGNFNVSQEKSSISIPISTGNESNKVSFKLNELNVFFDDFLNSTIGRGSSGVGDISNEMKGFSHENNIPNVTGGKLDGAIFDEQNHQLQLLQQQMQENKEKCDDLNKFSSFFSVEFDQNLNKLVQLTNSNNQPLSSSISDQIPFEITDNPGFKMQGSEPSPGNLTHAQKELHAKRIAAFEQTIVRHILSQCIDFINKFSNHVSNLVQSEEIDENSNPSSKNNISLGKEGKEKEKIFGREILSLSGNSILSSCSLLLSKCEDEMTVQYLLKTCYAMIHNCDQIGLTQIQESFLSVLCHTIPPLSNDILMTGKDQSMNNYDETNTFIEMKKTKKSSSRDSSSNIRKMMESSSASNNTDNIHEIYFSDLNLNCLNLNNNNSGSGGSSASSSASSLEESWIDALFSSFNPKMRPRKSSTTDTDWFLKKTLEFIISNSMSSSSVIASNSSQVIGGISASMNTPNITEFQESSMIIVSKKQMLLFRYLLDLSNYFLFSPATAMPLTPESKLQVDSEISKKTPQSPSHFFTNSNQNAANKKLTSLILILKKRLELEMIYKKYCITLKLIEKKNAENGINISHDTRHNSLLRILEERKSEIESLLTIFSEYSGNKKENNEFESFVSQFNAYLIILKDIFREFRDLSEEGVENNNGSNGNPSASSNSSSTSRIKNGEIVFPLNAKIMIWLVFEKLLKLYENFLFSKLDIQLEMDQKQDSNAKLIIEEKFELSLQKIEEMSQILIDVNKDSFSSSFITKLSTTSYLCSVLVSLNFINDLKNKISNMISNMKYNPKVKISIQSFNERLNGNLFLEFEKRLFSNTLFNGFFADRFDLDKNSVVVFDSFYFTTIRFLIDEFLPQNVLKFGWKNIFNFFMKASKIILSLFPINNSKASSASNANLNKKNLTKKSEQQYNFYSDLEKSGYQISFLKIKPLETQHDDFISFAKELFLIVKSFGENYLLVGDLSFNQSLSQPPTLATQVFFEILPNFLKTLEVFINQDLIPDSNLSLTAVNLLLSTSDYINFQLRNQSENNSTTDGIIESFFQCLKTFSNLLYRVQAQDIRSSLARSFFITITTFFQQQQQKIDRMMAKPQNDLHFFTIDYWMKLFSEILNPAFKNFATFIIPNAKALESIKILNVHHTRDNLKKQWAETLCLMIEGVARLFEEFFCGQVIDLLFMKQQLNDGNDEETRKAAVLEKTESIMDNIVEHILLLANFESIDIICNVNTSMFGMILQILQNIAKIYETISKGSNSLEKECFKMNILLKIYLKKTVNNFMWKSLIFQSETYFKEDRKLLMTFSASFEQILSFLDANLNNLFKKNATAGTDFEIEKILSYLFGSFSQEEQESYLLKNPSANSKIDSKSTFAKLQFLFETTLESLTFPCSMNSCLYPSEAQTKVYAFLKRLANSSTIYYYLGNSNSLDPESGLIKKYIVFVWKKISGYCLKKEKVIQTIKLAQNCTNDNESGANFKKFVEDGYYPLGLAQMFNEFFSEFPVKVFVEYVLRKEANFSRKEIFSMLAEAAEIISGPILTQFIQQPATVNITGVYSFSKHKIWKKSLTHFISFVNLCIALLKNHSPSESSPFANETKTLTNEEKLYWTTMLQTFEQILLLNFDDNQEFNLNNHNINLNFDNKTTIEDDEEAANENSAENKQLMNASLNNHKGADDMLILQDAIAPLILVEFYSSYLSALGLFPVELFNLKKKLVSILSLFSSNIKTSNEENTVFQLKTLEIIFQLLQESSDKLFQLSEMDENGTQQAEQTEIATTITNDNENNQRSEQEALSLGVICYQFVNDQTKSILEKILADFSSNSLSSLQMENLLKIFNHLKNTKVHPQLFAQQQHMMKDSSKKNNNAKLKANINTQSKLIIQYFPLLCRFVMHLRTEDIEMKRILSEMFLSISKEIGGNE